EWRKDQKKANLSFEKKIMKLRALKNTRQVTRPFSELSKKSKAVKIKAIVCTGKIPARFSRTQAVGLKISVVVEEHHKKLDVALKQSHERTKRPPISHYGLRSKIEHVTDSAI